MHFLLHSEFLILLEDYFLKDLLIQRLSQVTHPELNKSKIKANIFANNVFNLLFAFLVIIIIFIELFMPLFIYIIAPGFIENMKN